MYNVRDISDHLDTLHNLIRDFLCLVLSTKVWGQYFAFPNNFIDGFVNAIGACLVPQRSQHQCSGTDGCYGVGDSLTSDVWC